MERKNKVTICRARECGRVNSKDTTICATCLAPLVNCIYPNCAESATVEVFHQGDAFIVDVCWEHRPNESKDIVTWVKDYA